MGLRAVLGVGALAMTMTWAGPASGQAGRAVPESNVFHMPIDGEGPALAPGEQSRVVLVLCQASVRHNLTHCRIADTSGLSAMTRRRVLRWAAQQPPWTRPQAKPGEIVRLRVATGDAPISVPPVLRAELAPPDIAALGACAWAGIGGPARSSMIAAYTRSAADSPVGRAEDLQRQLAGDPELQARIAHCDPAREQHPREHLSIVLMHMLREAAVAKLDSFNISRAQLDNALADTPSVREPVDRMVLAMFGEGPTPEKIDWTDLYRNLGMLEIAQAPWPRQFVVDYAVGKAMEEHAIERLKRMASAHP